MVRWITGGGEGSTKVHPWLYHSSVCLACLRQSSSQEASEAVTKGACPVHELGCLSACLHQCPCKDNGKDAPPPPPYTPRWALVKLYFTILYFPFSSLPFPLPLPVICFRCHIELWVMTRIFIDCAWNSWNDRERLAGPVERYLDNMAFLCCGVVGIDPSCCLKCFVAWFCAFEVPFRTQSVHDSWVLWILFLLWVRKALLGLLLGHGPYWR